MNHKADYGKFDFVGKVGLFGGLSLLLVVVSLIYLGVKGLTYGIDFAGGTEIQVKFAQSVAIDKVRAITEVPGAKNVELQAFGEGNEYVIRFQTEAGQTDKETNEKQNEVVAKIKDTLMTTFAADKPEILRVDSVGPQVGAELKKNGMLAVFYCLLVILIYIAFRFDFKYAPGAVLCLAHDAIITLAVFTAVGKEMNVPILAAILTLIGFSLNDTIVVFDRIRETEGLYHDKGSKFVINKSINDMLWRTLITSGTTFVSSLCLFLFAGGVVADITFALCVGIIFGTYSSVYVAAPFILFMEKISPTTRRA